MSTNDASFHARITADAKQFVAEMQGAAAALAALVKQAETAGRTASKTPANEGAKAVREIKDAYSTASKEQEKLHSEAMQDIAAETRARKQANTTVASTGGSRWNAKAIPALPEGTNMAALAGVRMSLDQRMRDSKKALARDEAEFNRISIATMRQRDAEEAKSMRARIAMNRMHGQAFREDAARQARAQQQQMDAMVTGRYALYDQASGYELVARKLALLTAAMSSTVLVAAQFETAFTSVDRAMQPLPDEISGIRDSLLQMSTELPIAFADMSKIATLGAQMGITASGIESFTRNVSAFSAITGSTIDETAQKFGRIAALADIDATDFNKLGSAVAYTGINAVATEQEILALTESIAAATRNAGFGADEIIGFSTTLASLGVAPEQARGVVLRVFADITRAVDTGGKKLEAFGKIAGMSASKAAEMWRNSPEEYFNALLTGLGTVDNFTKAMDSLGFTETRETNVLQRLAQNMNIYNKSMQDSKKSYEEGTFLADAYAKTADNLDAKFSMLMNTLQLLGDAIGSGLIGPAGVLVDTLKDAAEAASGFFKTPLGQFVTPALTGITALVAGFSIFKAIQIKTIAQLFAMRTAMIQLGRAQESTSGAFKNATLSLMGLQRAVTMADGQVKFLTRSEYQHELAQMRVAGAVRLTTGETVFLTKAQYDLAIAEGKVAAGTAASSKAINGWAAQSKAAAFASRALTVAMSSIGWVGLGIGLLSTIGLFNEMNKTTLDIASSGGGLASFRDAIYKDTQAFRDGADAFGTYRSQVTETVNVASSYVNSLQRVSGGQTQLTSDLTKVNEKITEQTIALGENSKQWLANAMANDPAIIEMFKKYADAGQDFGTAISKAGIDLVKLQEAALKDPGKGAFNYLKGALSRTGYKEEFAIFQSTVARTNYSMEELAKVWSNTASDPGRQLIGTMILLAASTDTTTDAAARQTKIMEMLGVLMPTEATDDYTKSLGGLAKAVRTVVDYASDLAGIFSRVTEIKFGRQQALDDIASGWNNIKEKAKDARDAINKANASIAELTADRSVLEYQLSVAERYKDEKRAAVIRAKLAKIDADMADKQDDLKEATEQANMSTEGSTQNAIENRAALLGMAGSYQSLIEMYAKTGMKGDELERKITELSKEFANQAKAAGYAEEDIKPYVALFGEFKTVVDKTPRDVTVEFKSNVSAAKNALAEYMAQVKSANSTITTTFKSNGVERAAIAARIAALQNLIEVGKQQLAKDPLTAEGRRALGAGMTSAGYEIARLQTQLANLAVGGYVSGPGTANSDSIPAMLSDGEFVMRASAVNTYGVGFMNALNQQRVSTSMPTSAVSGGSQGSQVVYLSPDDRALLRAAIDRPISLYTDNQKIASSANAGNVLLAQRGLK